MEWLRVVVQFCQLSLVVQLSADHFLRIDYTAISTIGSRHTDMTPQNALLKWLARLLLGLLLHTGSALSAPFAADKLVVSARSQIGVTLLYDPSYRQLAYPMGDVPIQFGVCTDVVIRALRGQGIDLQALVHADMRAHFAEYPKNWGLKRIDRNIDHRRVPNLQRYFIRQNWQLKLPSDKKAEAIDALLPGDFITWMLPGNLPHIGIVSDRFERTGARRLVIHNVGMGAQEEDVLDEWPMTGHYRVSKEVPR
jgi:uncharacterized protein